MPQFKCPQCASVIDAEPGREAICSNCGFRAVVPDRPPAPPMPAPEPVMERAPPDVPRGDAIPVARSTAAWALLAAMVAVGTFFLAQYGIPFILGLGAIALGVVAYTKNKTDRRALMAAVLGGIAIVAALTFLVAR